MNTTPPTSCASWTRLVDHAQSWKGTRIEALFGADPARADTLFAAAPGMRLEYSRQRANALTVRLLCQLADERGFGEWRDALLRGEVVNTSEQRPAWHTALRAGADAPEGVARTLERMHELAAKLRSGGAHRIVSIGIGGSDLGPRLIADALKAPGDAHDVRFVANVDPLELERALAGADPATTHFIAVSKTFTTAETLANLARAKRWLGTRAPARHVIAATGNAEAARAAGIEEILDLPDWVGGRYSLWGAAGFAAMCAIGERAFDELLDGAREIDVHFATSDPGACIPVLMGLLGVWNINFFGAGSHAVLPYAHALRLLPDYLQQMEMESNGKCVDHAGRSLDYATAPVIFGAEGTVGQHSFHQFLHQGTQPVPADFIVVEGMDAALSANAQAQAEALLRGTNDPALPPWRRQPGDRPSSTLRLERLDARNLGRLLAVYEHKVFTQGVVWNLDSFDQWGVELGKALAKRILEKGN
jgi:glucose-6-phosphate isomerase